MIDWQALFLTLKLASLTTAILLAIAVAVSMRFTFVFGLAEFGLIGFNGKNPLDWMALPGMFSGLVAGVATKSGICEFVGFWVGMAAVYGLPGLLLDLAWQTILRLRRHLAP